MAMYMIRHIPTKTYYGLMNDQGKYSLVGFKKEADAKYVADCIASYKRAHQVFPPPDQKVYLMDRHLLKSDAEDEALWVEDHLNNMSFLYNLGRHNMDFQIVDEIYDLGDNNFEVKGRTLNIECSPDMIVETLLNDMAEEA
jgi:hypothetical protein